MDKTIVFTKNLPPKDTFSRLIVHEESVIVVCPGTGIVPG
jgi:hypothetical protein